MPSPVAYPKLRVFGPKRRFFDFQTDGDPLQKDLPLWFADVEVLEHGETSDWRHLQVRRDSVIPSGHNQLRAHMPGLAVIRCRVKALRVCFFGMSSESFTFLPTSVATPHRDVTLLIQTFPEAWQFEEVAPDSTGSHHRVLNAPRVVCVGGEIALEHLDSASGQRVSLLIPDSRAAASWTNLLKEWGEVESNSLIAHSSGLAFLGRPNLPWGDLVKQAGRYDIVLPRPVPEVERSPQVHEPVLIEINRQWLLSERDSAPAALSELRATFSELDRLLRVNPAFGSDAHAVRTPPTWTRLGLNHPDGPPRFYWLLSQPQAKPELRLPRGEVSLSICDQKLGERGVVPRSIATIDAETGIVKRSAKLFDVKLNAARQLSVNCSEVKEFKIPEEWTDRLYVSDRRLNWTVGRAITANLVKQLRAAFTDPKQKTVIERLIGVSSVEVRLPVGVANPLPANLRARTEVGDGVLRWFGLQVTSAELGQLETLSTTLPGPAAGVCRRLHEQLAARLTYQLGYANEVGDPDETVDWKSIETVYEPNDVADWLRTANGFRRPDPDDVPPVPNVDDQEVDGVVDPPVLWGNLPLENGWAMLPFLNTTDELYLRIMQPERPEPEAALISGAAILGNDDPRQWSAHRDEQRWNVTILDADLMTGTWTFDKHDGDWRLDSSSIELFQPELVLNGFLWLSTIGPTPADALPDFDAWLTAVRPLSLRSPRTYESFPSPFVLRFREGRCERALDPEINGQKPPLPAIADLGSWKCQMHENERLGEGSASRDLITRFAPVPGETERVTLSHQLCWLKGETVVPEALAELQRWINDSTLAPGFRDAAKKLRFKAQAIPVNQSPAVDIVEPMTLSSGSSLPWPRSAGWGVLFDRIDFQTVIHWQGGAANTQDVAVMNAWLQHPNANDEFKKSVQELLDQAARTVFEQLARHGFYQVAMEELPRPLVWQRHPTLPSIQSLPLTQSQSPPSHPSSSRQLAPFELLFRVETPPSGNEKRIPLPGDWTFGREDDHAARNWPVYRGKSQLLPPAREWHGQLPSPERSFEGRRFLPMTFLSLPGLIANPASAGDIAPIPDADWVPMQLSYGLPYLDEVHSLATLPRENGLSNALNDTLAPADQQGTAQPIALRRETFQEAWRELAELGLLATADAEVCLSPNASANAPQIVEALAEPYAWPVKVELTDRSYPGTLTVTDGADAARQIAFTEPLADGTVDSSQFPPDLQTPLRGWQGTWERTANRLLRLANFDNQHTNQLDLVGGSMAARIDSAQLRDQRGLLRGKTVESSGDDSTPKFLRTPVKLEKDRDPNHDVVALLTTTQESIGLKLGEFGSWQLWFRDLPVIGDIFERRKSASKEGVNDPDADGRLAGYREGYEWRLGRLPTEDGGSSPEWLPFGVLRFFPLTLESVEFQNDGQIKTLKVAGRLQLPLPQNEDAAQPKQSEERESEANAVLLTFNSLQLEAVSVLSPDKLPLTGNPADQPQTSLVWPLALRDGSPRLRAKGLSFDSATGVLTFDAPQVDLTLFGLAWSPRVDGTAKLSATGLHGATHWQLVVANDPSQTMSPVRVSQAVLRLDFTSGDFQHELSVDIFASWGDPAQPGVEVTKSLRMLPDSEMKAIVTGRFRIRSGGQASHLFLDEIVEDSSSLLTTAVQLHWSQMERRNFPNNSKTEPALYVLPGFGVASDSLTRTPGYASMSFEVDRGSRPLHQPPDFRRIAGISEIVFRCEWGDVMQEHQTASELRRLPSAAFGSSAGSVSIGWLAKVETDVKGQVGTISELLLNGLVEVKNLVSWPFRSVADELKPDNSQFTLIAEADAWNHWRHTARILLSQVKLGKGDVRLIPVGDVAVPTLFGLMSNDDSKRPIVQFLAVVEHQLVELEISKPLAGSGDAPGVKRVGRDFRWTVSQEVRWAHPAELAEFWRQFVTDALPSTPEKETAELARGTNRRTKPISHVASGWLRETLLKQLTAELPVLGDDSAVMELSVGLHLPRQSQQLRQGASAGDFGNVQVLPGEVDQAIPAEWMDFVPKGTRKEECWSLLVLPFLGRLQPVVNDGLEQSNGEWKVKLPTTGPKLRIDPILWLTAPIASRPPYVYELTSRSSAAAQVLRFADFDLLNQQQWPWVDPVSLETGWYRLLTPPVEATATQLDQPAESVLAALSEEGLGRLGRDAALTQLFDPVVTSYPPQSSRSDQPDNFADLEWRYGGLLLLQAVTLPVSPASQHGFAVVGKRLGQILQSWLEANDSRSPIRLPALTLLPPKMSAGVMQVGQTNQSALTELRQSISFAPTPYLGLKRISVPLAGEGAETITVFADIIVLGQSNRDTDGILKPIVLASQLWQRRIPETPGDTLEPLPDKDEVTRWAVETRRGLAGDSLMAVVRERRLVRAPGASLPSVRHQFFVLAPARTISLATPISRNIRAELGQLRFREGQYGGSHMPYQLPPTQLAPPRVANVQPLHFETSPVLSVASIKEPLQWDWGYSGLRLDIRTSLNAVGRAAAPWTIKREPDHDDAPEPREVWWNASSHPVQFTTQRPTGVTFLPVNYRAPAIRSLLPAPPNVPCPNAAAIDEAARQLDLAQPQPTDEPWQSVLPGEHSLFAIGGRPGAFVAMRSHVLNQALSQLTAYDVNQVTNSGSVPVQHRWPRPVHIPPNREVAKLTQAQSVALAPWGSWFDLEDSALVNRSLDARLHPHDSLFLFQNEQPFELDVELHPDVNSLPVVDDPAIVSDQWSKPYLLTIRLAARSKTLDAWDLTSSGLRLTLAWGGTAIRFDCEGPTKDDPTVFQFRANAAKPNPTTLSDAERLAANLGTAPHGMPLRFELTVPTKEFQGVNGPPQVALLHVRFSRSSELPLPLAPAYCQFEDPEYSRRLASPTARSSKGIKRAGDTQTVNVTLAADRQEYNPTTPIFLLFHAEGQADDLKQSLKIRRINTAGVISDPLRPSPHDLTNGNVVRLQFGATENSATDTAWHLMESLNPGERIVLSLETSGLLSKNEVRLVLQVVADPVTPPPEAGYALLREVSSSPLKPVECVRFAWSPSAGRIDLVDPRDLLREVARRRAVFVWRATQRHYRLELEANRYSVQKISPNGSTIIPPCNEVV